MLSIQERPICGYTPHYLWWTNYIHFVLPTCIGSFYRRGDIACLSNVCWIRKHVYSQHSMVFLGGLCFVFIEFFLRPGHPYFKSLGFQTYAPNEQGIAQGSILGITSFANLISPLIYSPISGDL